MSDNTVHINIAPVVQPSKAAVQEACKAHNWKLEHVVEVLTAFGLQQKAGTFLVRLPTQGTLYPKDVRPGVHQELGFDYPQTATALCGGFLTGARLTANSANAEKGTNPVEEQNRMILAKARKVVGEHWTWTHGKGARTGSRVDLPEQTARELYRIKLEHLAPKLSATTRNKLANDPDKRLAEVVRLEGIKRARAAGMSSDQIRAIDWGAYIDSKRSAVQAEMQAEIDRSLEIKLSLAEEAKATEAQFASEFEAFLKNTPSSA